MAKQLPAVASKKVRGYWEKANLVFLLTALAALSACADNGEDTDSGLILDRGLNGAPESLDPHKFSSNQSASVLRDIGEGLVRYDNNGTLVGGVAETWNVSHNGTEYVFQIREDARWSNGADLVAADFVTSYRDLVAPDRGAVNSNNADHIENAIAIQAGDLQPPSLGVFADSPKTLRIRLEHQTPYFLQLLAHPSMFPKYSGAQGIGSDSTDETHVTNGAYILAEHILGSTLRLSKNKHYWDHGNVSIPIVVYHILEESAELSRFRSGGLDITENVPSTQFGLVKSLYAAELRVAPRQGVYFYGFNLTDSLFADNLAIRHALSLAVDRKTLVEKVIARGEEEAFSWVPPGYKNYVPQTLPESNLGQPEREERARALYSEGGYGPERPLRFELRYNTSDVQQRIALAVKSMWEESLGAEVALVNEEFKVLLSNIESAEETEVFRLSWTGDYNDPHTFLKIFESENSSNFTGYSNPHYDSLMKEASTQSNPETRAQLLQDAELTLLADHAVIPLYFYVGKHLVSERVQGWQDNLLDIHPSQYLSIRRAIP